MCNCEHPKVYAESLRTARKEYKCRGCYHKIPAKTKYFAVKGLWDNWENYRLCESCKHISEKFSEQTGECMPLEGVLSSLEECGVIYNDGNGDDSPLWVSTVTWLEIKSHTPLRVAISDRTC